MSAKTSKNWANESGEFVRQTSSFREVVKKGGKFEPEAGRYHIYISSACPWAWSTVCMRALKGLEDVISVTIVDSHMTEDGWSLSDSPESKLMDAVPCPYGAKYLRELYFKADPNYNARFTVPLFWDKKTNTAVNNESSDILKFLNSEFNDLAKYPEVDLYPADKMDAMEEMNSFLYDNFNNGVYKTGFATKQEVYEKNCKNVFMALDKMESVLSKSRYLQGDKLTVTDIFGFRTAIRFDPVYLTHFKCNLFSVKDHYPSIVRWMREFYQHPGVADTCSIKEIKRHYFLSHPKINPNGIIGLNNGPDLTIKPEFK